MKICLINNLYKPWQRGGADRIVNLLQKGLTKKGFDVFIVSTKPHFFARARSYSYERIYYLSSFYYNLKKIPKFFRLFWHVWDMFDFITCLKVFFILAREKPNLVITNNLKGVSFLLPILFKILKIKHIHILHDLQLIHPSGLVIWGQEKILSSWSTKFYTRVNALLFSSPSAIISPSKWLLVEHKNRGFFPKSRVKVLPNPIKLEINKEKIRQKRFLYVGELVEHKGILFLIKVFNNIASYYKNWEFWIIGEGDLKNKAKKEAGKQIKFLGRLSHEEVFKIMRESFALIVPSLCYENSPTVIYEAASCGLPVIASRLGGTTELVRYLGGILFNPGDKKDLTKKINWVQENPEQIKKISQKAKQRVVRYILDNYIKEFELILRNINKK